MECGRSRCKPARNEVSSIASEAEGPIWRPRNDETFSSGAGLSLAGHLVLAFRLSTSHQLLPQSNLLLAPATIKSPLGFLCESECVRVAPAAMLEPANWTRIGLHSRSRLIE